MLLAASRLIRRGVHISRSPALLLGARMTATGTPSMCVTSRLRLPRPGARRAASVSRGAGGVGVRVAGLMGGVDMV
jgi:hypothetical protein